ncbi:MAG: chloride channel protein [Deltaproteobacteria bacterium]|nr:chloride channel protein [Deltaproteobacteria bacterium]MCW8892784.1 chloride channel protein [Deltaproteobacteria bacterium]MCW9048957.1 chloride channel protein [Deltaproteobacteria bacterium]
MTQFFRKGSGAVKITWKFSPNRENLIALLVVAVLIGIITGALAVAFRYLLLYTTDLFWPDPLALLDVNDSYPWYLVFLIPIIGGLIVGPLVTKFSPETRGAGVPEVIEVVVNREGTIRHRTALFKSLFTALSIGCGASVGREGPVVHIGSSVGSSIAQMLHLPAEWKRVFLACGAASGIAATFNAPMAGMLFAAEIILVDFQVSYLSHIAISAVTATVISHHFLGSLPTFQIPAYELVSYAELPLYALLGLCAGLLSILFIRSVSAVEDLFNKVAIPLSLRPAVAGALIGSIAIFWPHILGVGYESINLTLTSQMTLGLMALVLGLKLLATASCVGAGFSGGIFAPSLVLGALLGGTFGVIAATIFPGQVDTSAAYSLIGMGAVVAGTTLAPITAIFTIFELTYNFDIILPLMTCCITSLVTVQKLYGYSIYETKLLRKGIRMVRGNDVNLLRSLQVGDYMDTQFEAIGHDMRLGEVLLKAENSSYPHFPVLDNQDKLVGILSMSDLRGFLAEVGELSELIVVSEIMTHRVSIVRPTDNFETAFEIFEGKQISTLPVVRETDQKLLGILKKSDLLLTYNQKILKMNITSASG